MSESLQNKRLLWLGHLERTEESFLPSKCRKFQDDSSLNREKPTKTWSKVIHKCESQQGGFIDSSSPMYPFISRLSNSRCCHCCRLMGTYVQNGFDPFHARKPLV